MLREVPLLPLTSLAGGAGALTVAKIRLLFEVFACGEEAEGVGDAA